MGQKRNDNALNPGVAIHTWVKLSTKVNLLDRADKSGKSLSKFTGEIIEKWIEQEEAKMEG